MRRYRLSPEAEGDLDNIKRYLMQQGSTGLARYVLGEIRAALRFLAAAPGAGHLRDDLTDEKAMQQRSRPGFSCGTAPGCERAGAPAWNGEP